MTGLSFRDLFGHRLWVLAHAVEERTEAAIQAVCGLSMREARILATVSSAGEARLDYIREAAGLERAYASRLIAGLVARGLLEKKADPRDQRTASWLLTGQGRQVHAAIHREAVQRNRTWLEALSPEQQTAFNGCIDVLTARFQSSAGEKESAGSTGKTRARSKGSRRSDDSRTDAGSGAVDDAGSRGGPRARTRADPRN